MRPHLSRFAVLASTLLTLSVVSVSSGQSASAAPPTCDAAEYRQFDFWVGDWTVTTAAGRAGTNLVTLEEKGCLIHEHWQGARGGTGQSFNFFDRADGLWHQVWVSSTGSVLRFAGEYHDGRLVLRGDRTGRNGNTLHDRLTFFHNADGTVRQLWESSPDGQRWQTVFDGLYTKQVR
jgi:hypothetical protein